MTSYEETRARAIALATKALHAAVRKDWPAAQAAMQAVSDETGGKGVLIALIAFCDTLIGNQNQAAGRPAFTPAGTARPVWLNTDTGQVEMNADDVPPAARWAGQLVAARAAMDHDAFNALLTAIPKDRKACGEYAGVLLQACAGTARITSAGAS